MIVKAFVSQLEAITNAGERHNRDWELKLLLSIKKKTIYNKLNQSHLKLEHHGGIEIGLITSFIHQDSQVNGRRSCAR